MFISYFVGYALSLYLTFVGISFSSIYTFDVVIGAKNTRESDTLSAHPLHQPLLPVDRQSRRKEVVIINEKGFLLASISSSQLANVSSLRTEPVEVDK